MTMNKYQTVFTEKELKELPKEVVLEYNELMEAIPFIKWLSSPEKVRGYAKDKIRWDNPNNISNRKEDKNGKIHVEITKPHILEDMDFFRERAIFFNSHGKYTNLIPNPNPKSDYAKFWKEELKRWKHGLIRPSDGEWIPGNLYFYWNYCPIWVVKKEEGSDSRGDRVRSFPSVWLGDYLFFHYLEQGRELGQHAKMLKTRGCGASFKMGSTSPRNMYVYPGSGNPNFHLASDKSFLLGDKGVFGKVMDTLDWVATHTPFPKLRLTDSKKSMEIQIGYLNEYGVRKGLLSSVYGISMKDNPDKARGIRGPLIHYEEDGVFPDLENIWNINRRATEQGGIAYGQQVSLGTGGTEGSNFASSEKLFYNPNAYNIYGIPNVFDKNSDGNTKCGFFWGAYLNREGCYNLLNGEPDVSKALMDILLIRYKTRLNASDSKTITQNAAEEPITPQDAVMRVSGTMFPVADLKEHLSNISVDLPNFLSSHYVGEITIDGNGNISFINNVSIYPIRDYPALDSKQGAIEIFELPPKVIAENRFIIGVDTYDDDAVSYSSSLGSTIVFDRWTRRIVAEFTGRPKSSDDFYIICYKLARFYKARIMYENNKKGLYAYFNKNGWLNILADTPEILVDKQLTTAKQLLGNVSKGVNATTPVNSYGLRLQAEWMLEKKYIPEQQEEKEEGEEVDTYVPNLTTIRSIGYLKEAIAWHPKINTDRVSAMNMVMIYDEELSQYDFGRREKKTKRKDDTFFDKIYNTNNVNNIFGYNNSNYMFNG